MYNNTDPAEMASKVVAVESDNERDFSVEYNGQEVENPILRVVVAIAVMILVVGVLMLVAFAVVPAIAFIFGIFVLVGVVIVAAMPLHYLLRALGRRGFVERSPGNVKVEISRKGFQRR